jgi:uncharacterized protein YjiS (DUF1127 family)
MNILRSYQNWRLYRETTHELRQLSDRSLNDMGIARADIRRVARHAVKN